MMLFVTNVWPLCAKRVGRRAEYFSFSNEGGRVITLGRPCIDLHLLTSPPDPWFDMSTTNRLDKTINQAACVNGQPTSPASSLTCM